MKRLLFLSLAALMVLVVSCKKDKPGNKIPEGAVDLGIVMTREDGTTYKLYWAKSNLSEDGLCANPEDYGDYFAWGETEPKLSYSVSSYTFMDNPSNLTEVGRDVAHVKLDGNWRMPTSKEFQELIDNCTSTWTTQNGVTGRLFIGKKSGYTDKSIFLPAAGMRLDSYLGYNSTDGYYRSSSIVPKSSDAWYLHFLSDRAEIRGSQRRLGYSVRPVYED